MLLENARKGLQDVKHLYKEKDSYIWEDYTGGENPCNQWEFDQINAIFTDKVNFGLRKDLVNVAEEYCNKIANAMSKVSPNPSLAKRIRNQIGLLNSIDLAEIKYDRTWFGGANKIIDSVEREINSLERKIDKILKDTLNLVTDIMMSDWEEPKKKKTAKKRG